MILNSITFLHPLLSYSLSFGEGWDEVGIGEAKLMKTKKRHYINFDIAGFSYWEECLVFNELKIGTELTFMREEDNKFDSYAVAIYYGESKLGFIPRNTN
jgi:hypothetical protein